MANSMFLEIVKSEGLAHLSYILGGKGKAAVIDPKRDCRDYIDIARQKDAEITHIFETHRNEDYVIGSRELSDLTGAQIYHGGALDFKYGNPVKDDDTFALGDLIFKIIETPGHTYESISIAVYDKNFGDQAVGVFTGDALFIGDVGRTDFFPDRSEEVAGLLYDSVFNKLLPLGDHVILYPAHGSGSVCGGGMASREFSTLGYEKKFNPVLQKTDKNEFIKYKVNERHYQPPYFRRMEELNISGKAPYISPDPIPRPLDANRFSELMDQGMTVVDIRSPEAFAGAFIPGSLALPLEMISSYAGWFLSHEAEVGIVADTYEKAQVAVRRFQRLGYDKVAGYLADGLLGWETAGRRYDRIPAVHAKELAGRIRKKEDFILLDVRKKNELETGYLPGTLHVYLGYLPDNLDKLDKNQRITTFCGSGVRAIIAASILKKNGFENVENSLGSMAACNAAGCPIEKPDLNGFPVYGNKVLATRLF